MKTFPILAAVSTFCVAAFAEPELPPAEPLSRATVTIPYSELRALWEAAHPRKSNAAPALKPPVSHLVSRAECHLQLGETMSTMTAAFDVEPLEGTWQTIPLLGGDARLEKVDVAERVIVSPDGYALLTNAAGKTTVTMQLTAPGLPSFAADRGLRLKLGAAMTKRLRVSGIPPGAEARVDGLLPNAGSDDGAAIFHLPSEAREIALTIGAPRAEKPAQPSVWQVQSQVLARYAEGRLHVQSRVFAHADAGSGLEASLVVPANAAALAVTGEDLAGWTAARRDDGQRLVQVRWKTPDVLDRELGLNYTVPQSPLAEEWIIAAAGTPGAEGERHLYAIAIAEGLELKGDGLRGAVATPRLPQWMRDAIGGAACATAEAGPQLALRAHWLPAMATAEALITEAKSQLRLVADGSMQVTSQWSVRHDAPLAWRLELPAGAEILTCSVGGRPSRPVQREAGGIELSLPSAKGTTTVAVQYATKTKPLDPVSGQTALELPRTPLFIERLDWAITIPEMFEVTALEGNVAVATRPPASEGSELTIHLRKELCRGERPSVELFYQRRSLEK